MGRWSANPWDGRAKVLGCWEAERRDWLRACEEKTLQVCLSLSLVRRFAEKVHLPGFSSARKCPPVGRQLLRTRKVTSAGRKE